MNVPGLNRSLRWPRHLNELASFPFRLGIRFYQLGIRPFLPATCRYEPSCSNYGVEALETHGLIRGTGLTIWRVLRCNPLGRGGIDPVPVRPSSATGAQAEPETEGAESV